MLEVYILDGTTPVKVTMLEWGQWMETADRTVAKTNIAPKVVVSTVFLGINHAFGNGPPVLFETMVFAADGDEGTWRYHTWEEAMKGHATVVKETSDRYNGNNILDFKKAV